MKGDEFYFAYVLTAGNRIVHFGAGSVASPEATAVMEYLLRAHGEDLFWDASDHQFCPSREVATELVGSMRSDRSATPGCGRARLVRATGAAQVSRGVQCAERLNAAGVMSGTSSPKTSRWVPSRSKAHAR